MKKTYITPMMEQTIIKTGSMLTILNISGNTDQLKDNIADTKQFGAEYSLSEQYIWE